MAIQNQTKSNRIIPKICKYVVFLLNARELYENKRPLKVSARVYPPYVMYIKTNATRYPPEFLLVLKYFRFN